MNDTYIIIYTFLNIPFMFYWFTRLEKFQDYKKINLTRLDILIMILTPFLLIVWFSLCAIIWIISFVFKSFVNSKIYKFLNKPIRKGDDK